MVKRKGREKGVAKGNREGKRRVRELVLGYQREKVVTVFPNRPYII
jgi:hypothetical protein